MGRAALLAAAALLCAACGTGGDTAPGTALPSKHLVYTRALGTPKQAVWIGDVNGARMRRLTRGGYGLVSPDGRTIAVSRRAGIFTVDPNRGERFIGRGRPAAWLPDSRHLLAVRQKALVNIDLDDRSVDVIERREVTTWSISPDGTTLAYDVYLARPPSGECGFDIYSARLDGTEKRRLTTGGRSSHPVWGPDSIAFAYRPTGTGCFKPRIWQMGTEGGQRAPVMRTLPNRFATLGRYGVRPFGWVFGSPLLLATIPTEWGAELALVSTRSGRARVADLDPRPRRKQPMYADHPSRDGRYVVGAACGAEGPCTIRIYSVAAGRARELITGDVRYPHWNR